MRIRTGNKRAAKARRAAIRRRRKARIILRSFRLLTAQRERYEAGLPALRELFEEIDAIGTAALIAPLPVRRRGGLGTIIIDEARRRISRDEYAALLSRSTGFEAYL